MQNKRRKESSKPGQVVCLCGRGYGSLYDGKCYRCRGNITAADAKAKAEQQK